jgi:hypothetical protein
MSGASHVAEGDVASGPRLIDTLEIPEIHHTEVHSVVVVLEALLESAWRALVLREFFGGDLGGVACTQ